MFIYHGYVTWRDSVFYEQINDHAGLGLGPIHNPGNRIWLYCSATDVNMIAREQGRLHDLSF